MTALAKVGFAHRSQTAGGFGNPPRVPIIILEERVGVEPTLPCGKHDFQSCPFGHSGISPIVKRTLGGSFPLFSFSFGSSVPMTALAKVGFAHRSQSAGGFGNPFRTYFIQFPISAWGAGELCSPRTIAGGFGNPLRVPIKIEERVGVEPTLPFGKPDFESGAFGHSAISP